MLSRHGLTPVALADLAAGFGDAATIRELQRGQLSKRRLLLGELIRSAPRDVVGAGYDLLEWADQRFPSAVNAALVLPHVGGWLAWCLRRLWRHDPVRPATAADLGHLSAVAAVAAAAAGLDFEVPVPVRSGTVMLPGWGRAMVGARDWVTVRRREGRLLVGAVEVADGADGWAPLRRFRHTVDDLCLDVRLDDLDPFRDCDDSDHAADYRPTERLDGAAAARWEERLGEAWLILVRRHPRYAAALADGLRSIVPLSSPSSDRGVNVTAEEAFGAMSLTLPPTGREMAVALLHEFQHGKLGAFADISPLIDKTDKRRFYAPWRADPRPLSGLLQGAYAFQGVTDFWRVERAALDGGQARKADVEFAHWRERVWHALSVLESSGACTEQGLRFLDGMRAEQRRWRDERVNKNAEELAREAAEDHWFGWLLRNRVPDPERVRALATGWLAGEEPIRDPVAVRTITEDRPKFVRSPRSDLVQLWMDDPDGFLERYGESTDDAASADIAYARGAYAAAQRGYLARIAGSADVDGWIGLALTCHHTAHDRIASLYEFPELVYAVYQEIRARTGAPDPVELARWLDGIDRRPDRAS